MFFFLQEMGVFLVNFDISWGGGLVKIWGFFGTNFGGGLVKEGGGGLVQNGAVLVRRVFFG